jgi:hypothetical protein
LKSLERSRLEGWANFPLLLPLTALSLASL